MRRILVLVALLGSVLAACSGKDRWYEQGQPPEADWEKAGLAFVQDLMRHDFSAAHRRLTNELQSSLTIADLESATRRISNERFVKLDDPWVLSSIETWPDKELGDLGMAYIQIGGDGNEAITVTIAKKEDELRVRDIAWGRP